MARWEWSPYVPVAQRRAIAQKEMNKLRKKGLDLQPVRIQGRAIAKSFWGKGWCEHLESFSDYQNRLPRGRTYVRNGSVCHLDVLPGRVEAIVSGSKLYRVSIDIKKLGKAKWERLKNECAGKIGSLIELLKGQLSSEVMAVVSQKREGLFPLPREIKMSCSCPDRAVMCKHVCAALYGVGSRLDSEPSLLFTLRGLDPQELIAASAPLPDEATACQDTLADDLLEDIFGVEIIPDEPPPPAAGRKASSTKPAQKKLVSQKPEAAKPSKPKKTPKTRPFSPTGGKISKLRQKSGQSVAEFAERIGVSAATVYRWESTPGALKLHGASLNALQELHDSFRKG